MEGVTFLREPKVQELIKALLDGTIEQLEPAYSLEKGQHYPLIETTLELSTEEANELLERLVNTGILAEKITGTILKCPECESDLIIRMGRYGKFIGCSSYPKCKHMEPLEKPQDSGIECPECHASTANDI